MARFPGRAARIGTSIVGVVVAGALLGGCVSSTTPAPSTAASSVAPTPQAPPATGVKPTVVLVHGAWADTSSWDGEVSALEQQGYDVRAIANPSRISPPMPSTFRLS